MQTFINYTNIASRRHDHCAWTHEGNHQPLHFLYRSTSPPLMALHGPMLYYHYSLLAPQHHPCSRSTCVLSSAAKQAFSGFLILFLGNESLFSQLVYNQPHKHMDPYKFTFTQWKHSPKIYPSRDSTCPPILGPRPVPRLMWFTTSGWITLARFSLHNLSKRPIRIISRQTIHRGRSQSPSSGGCPPGPMAALGLRSLVAEAQTIAHPNCNWLWEKAESDILQWSMKSRVLTVKKRPRHYTTSTAHRQPLSKTIKLQSK